LVHVNQKNRLTHSATKGSMGWVANPWTAVAATICIQSSCGASYTFSIYSAVLKSTQGYTVSVFQL